MEPIIPLVGEVGTFLRQEVDLSCRVEILSRILSRNLVPLDQPVKETGDFMANMHPWYYVVNLYQNHRLVAI